MAESQAERCPLLCRFLGRRVASVEMRASLPASEKRQGTESRVGFAEGSGCPMGNWRRRGWSAGSAPLPKRAGLTRRRAGCDR